MDDFNDADRQPPYPGVIIEEMLDSASMHEASIPNGPITKPDEDVSIKLTYIKIETRQGPKYSKILLVFLVKIVRHNTHDRKWSKIAEKCHNAAKAKHKTIK